MPSDKIVQRYGRSIALLSDACEASNRAYVFDNSGEQHVLIAEVTDGETMTLHADTVPQWFTATSLWQSFQPGWFGFLAGGPGSRDADGVNRARKTT